MPICWCNKLVDKVTVFVRMDIAPRSTKGLLRRMRRLVSKVPLLYGVIAMVI